MIEARADPVFRHEALLYACDDDFRELVGGFLAAAVEAGEPTFVVVDAQKIEWLREALGSSAQGVEFADMAEIGRNPGRILGAWQIFLADHRDAVALCGVGEPLAPPRTAVERDECYVNEALANLAFAQFPLWLVCPYDTSRLAVADLDRVGHTHPFVRDGRTTRASHALVSPAEIFGASFPEPARVDLELDFDLGALHEVRAVIGLRAAEFGLESDRIVGLVLAASEVATNSVAYGGGRGRLRAWTDDSGLVCEIQDAGRIADPLIGRVRPRRGATSGYGLWVARQLCDLVQIRSGPHGTVVRLRMIEG
jgi:anti-sigma regulatory factor (Ser/Thr protein kinase)